MCVDADHGDENCQCDTLHGKEPDDGTQVAPPDDQDAGEQQDARAEGDELGEEDRGHDYAAWTRR